MRWLILAAFVLAVVGAGVQVYQSVGQPAHQVIREPASPPVMPDGIVPINFR